MDMLEPQFYTRPIDFIEVYTLEGHGVFVGGARDIFQKIKEDLGSGGRARRSALSCTSSVSFRTCFSRGVFTSLKLSGQLFVTHSQPETS